jgi:hypothetical protein
MDLPSFVYKSALSALVNNSKCRRRAVPMNFLFFLFMLTVPVLYLYGLVNFIRGFGKSSPSALDGKSEQRFGDVLKANRKLQEKVKTLEQELNQERKLSQTIKTRAELFPDMQLATLIQDLFPSLPEPEAQAIMDEFVAELKEEPAITMAANITQESPKIVEEVPSFAQVLEQNVTTEPKHLVRELPEVAPAKYIEAQIAPKEAFNWANWFSDNAINLLLFLGAFLVVAAVSFFMYSQWGNIDPIIKFGILLTFTGTWYIAGMLFNRGESFKTVGITFVTIGAVITPFVGVGYYIFMLNDPSWIGIVWLITSIFSTVTYMTLSLVFQRRYFTYFGTLSILAMLLSLVQVTEVPQPYFILAGTVTALLLLLGRVSLRFFPHLDNYMGQDYELSSIGTLVLSVGAGLAIVILQGEPAFFSVDVLAVGIVGTIYLWVYSSLHFEDKYLLGAQLLTVLMAGHAAFSNHAWPATGFAVMFAANFVLQAILHLVLSDAKTLQDKIHHLALFIASVLYALSTVVFDSVATQFTPMAIALVLMMQLSFYIRRTGQHLLYFGCVALSYAALAHFLLALNVEMAFWGFYFVALGLVETVAASFVRDDHLRQAQLDLSLFLMAISGFASLLFDLLPFTTENNGISFGTAFAALFGFAVISLIEERRSYKLLPYQAHILGAFVGVGYFLSSLHLQNYYASGALGLATVGMFYLSYRPKQEPILMNCAALMLYPTLGSLLNGIDPIFMGTAFVMLAALQALVAYMPLEKNLRQGIAYIGMLGVGLSSFFNMIYWFDRGLLDYSVIIGTSFVTLGFYALMSGYEARRADAFFDRHIHLMGILTAMGTLLLGVYFNIAVFSLLGFSLALIGLLLLLYRHQALLSSAMAITVSSHLVLWYLLKIFGIDMQLPFFLGLSAFHLAFAYLPLKNKAIRAAVTTVGIWGLVIFLSISALLAHPNINQIPLSLTLVWLGLGYLAFFEEKQRRLESPLVDSITRQLPIVAAAIAYGISLSFFVETPFLTLAYALGLLYFLLINYRHSAVGVWLYAGMGLLYPILAHTLMGFKLDADYWGIATTILAATQVMLLYTPVFDEKTSKGIMQIGVAGLSLSSLYLLTFPRAGDFSLYFLTVLGAIGVFAVFSFLEIGKNRINRYMHLLPVGIAGYAYAETFLPLWFSSFSTDSNLAFFAVAFALAFSLHLALAYRHAAIKLYLFGMTLTFYPALWHVLALLDVPFEYYPLAIALLSLVLYLARQQIVGESGAGVMSFIILMILGITSVSPYFLAYNNQSYYLYAWAAGYFFLLIFWHSRLVETRATREYLLAGAIFVQYLMHVEFGNHFIDSAFADIQWFTAGLAILLMGISVRESHFHENKLPMPLLYVAAAVALLPCYYQSISEDNLIYSLIAIAFGLGFVGIGILYHNGISSSLGVLAVIIAVLIPTGEFIQGLNLPQWVYALAIGIGLIATAVGLTTRRRNNKKEAHMS